MLTQKLFAYTVNSRVVWFSDKIFHIPVLHDLYRVHLVQNTNGLNINDCTSYTVKAFHKFLQEELVLSPLKEDEAPEAFLNHHKIKAYVKLSELINYSLDASVPLAFQNESENEKFKILARSFINNNAEGGAVSEKNFEFVSDLLKQKKQELQDRYISFVHDLKAATSLHEVQMIDYKLVFEGIDVV